jgi:type II restriction/modification system DNA methylase subunit YeeA
LSDSPASASGTMAPLEFVAKWSGSTRTEHAAAQEHFIDICRMLGVQTPNEADQHGDWYAFEKGAEKLDGGDGFADVWKRMHFAWEYKKKHANLDRAYAQLQQYREALENPPLLVVCDLDRFEVHTNFTNTAKAVYRFSLADLKNDPREPLRILRAIMAQPEALRPQVTPQQITERAASQFAQIAGSLTKRGHDAETVAHFLNRVLFCLFAEDAGLLPRGLLTGLIDSRRGKPGDFADALKGLFENMAHGGGYHGNDWIDWFNGGLFEDDSVIEMSVEEMAIVRDAAQLDWSQVEPAVLGTLFERGLDPDKRSQLGAHYTDPATIARVVEPVVMVPLRREFDAMREQGEGLIDGRTPAPLTRDGRPRENRPKWERDAEAAFFGYLERLRSVKVLDPACGSGNFLYVTLPILKDLEKEVIMWGAEKLKLTQPFPDMGPHNLRGIDINPYAAELARVSIWVGHIQWMLDNGFAYARDPILQPLHNIECRDAILAYDDAGNPVPAEWPEAEFIVGNPPFLVGS